MGRTPGDAAPTAGVPGHGGPRSEATRRTILEVARRTFAARGYEQTTIRAVAAEAGIDASMVMRYFGSKAGLFAAASTTHLQAPDLSAVPASERGELMVRHFVERWERSPDDDDLVLLLRTAVTNDAVAGQLRLRFQELIVAPIAALGRDHPEQRGVLIGTQLLGLMLCRYVLRLQPLASASVEEVIADVAPVIQRRLDDASASS
ncbi:MAG TPA: TetR family transcriptional regulator [Solirubrobacteraceae bacterium]|jgi:AcrR family transcriptional regulator|nr:TetR family transcriptional regulator [Solirubrobacteraceae bacterium]